MKKYLSQVIESIRKGNHDDAQIAFNEYISEKTAHILSENYGDSEFEHEVEMYIMNTEKYYYHARQLMADDADYSEWEQFVMSVADEIGVYPEDDDDVYDTVQDLMRNKEMLGEGILSDKELEEIGNKKRNFVAKNMNKVNRSQTHRDRKNDYKRKPKHKKKFDESAGGKRKVKVTYDNGQTVTTSMAATASDSQIKSHFAVGKEFNLGSGGKDKMAKVKSVKILEAFDPHKFVVSTYKKSGRHHGYVSQGMDKDDRFRRAKKVVDDIIKGEGINMSVEDKHVTARYIANMDINESKLNESDYKLYHPTYTSAINAAIKKAKEEGYEVKSSDVDQQISFGPGRPKNGDTVKHSIRLSKNGKRTKEALHIQVYDRGTDKNSYELNTYIS